MSKHLRSAGLFIVVAVALTSCGGDESSKPVAAKASSSPATVPSAEPESGSGSGSVKRGNSTRLELQEGITTQSDQDYTTGKFSPRATFHTPALAYPFFGEQDAPRIVELNSEVGGLVLFRPTEIFDPATGRAAPLPDDLTEWVVTNEHIDAGAVEPVSLGNLKGSRVNGVVTSTIAKKDDCDASCIQLAPVPGGQSIWFIKGDYMTVMSFHVKGQLIGVALYSDKSGFKQLTSAANKLLKTLEFH